MKVLKQVYHYLGGIHFAIALILTAALIVVGGTFLESVTNSHLYAAYWTYEHPFFQILLFLFFVNILFSALRRWPFKKKHIPFLITHLGLLMIISGTIIKNRYGLQGQMSIWEGSGSQEVLLPHTFSLYIESENNHSAIALPSFQSTIYFPYHFPSLSCKVIGYAPHVKEKLETWIKEDKLYVSGIPPLSVEPWGGGSLHHKAGRDLKIMALRTDKPEEAAQLAYLQGLMLHLRKDEQTTKIALADALQEPFGEVTALLHLSPSESTLEIQWKKEKFSVALQGPEALLVKPRHHVTVDLIRVHPTLCFIETPEATHLYAFDQHGRVHREIFNPADLKSLLSYDNGFAGYGVQANIPFPSYPTSRTDKEKAIALELSHQLEEALVKQPELSPPLQLLQKATLSANMDFVKTFVQFLNEWQNSPGLTFFTSSLDQALLQLDWKLISKKEQQALLWTHRLFEQLEGSLTRGETIEEALEKNHWPFSKNSSESTLNDLAEQVFSLIPYLPELDFPAELSIQEHANFLALFLRLYGIDHQLLYPPQKGDLDALEKVHGDKDASFVIETSLTHRMIPETPPTKLEEHRPGIALEIASGKEKQTVAFALDPQASGMKWPLLKGKYLARFQPHHREIPYRLRLRQARQILYPQSSKVYSYESDLLVTEKGKAPIPVTLSMNRVYETWDGYRFYLSGVGTSADANLKRIQLAVNYDPAKYVLTYPGATLVFMGIILLFWIQPYRKAR